MRLTNSIKITVSHCLTIPGHIKPCTVKVKNLADFNSLRLPLVDEMKPSFQYG